MAFDKGEACADCATSNWLGYQARDEGLSSSFISPRLARFWDTHDLTDFEDELEEVREIVFERNKVRIRFRADEVEVIKNLARARGLSDSNRIREWVLERIHGEARPAGRSFKIQLRWHRGRCFAVLLFTATQKTHPPLCGLAALTLFHRL